MKTRPAYFSSCRRVAASPRRVPQRRGTVLVLVVAVLALLAVIGTAYILASRADKANSSAMNVSQDFDFARKAVMSQTVQIIANGPIGADGNVGSYAIAGSYGTQPARLYDFPDAGEPWLATHLHPQAGDLNLYSAMGPATTPNNVFDPATGGYNLTGSPIPYGTAPYTTSLSGTVVGDQTVGDATSDDPPTARADSLMYLLPFSDASGIRYRYWERIIDTNRMANLNTGATDDPSATGDAAGSWFSMIRLAPAAGTLPASAAYFNTGDTPAYLQATLPNGSGLGRAGTSASNAMYSGQNWQQQVLHYEKPTDAYLAFFDLSDELDLRAYGEFGTPYHIRPASTSGSPTNYLLWPRTLSANPGSPTSGQVTGNPPRRNYTTISESRQLRPYPDPGNKYAITPGDGLGAPAGYAAANMFPARPAPVSANPLTTTSSPNDLMFYTAMAASNIATIMDYSTGNAIAGHGGDPAPYMQEETCAFVANYCTAKWNGFMPDPSLPGKNAYFLPAGPSFVDGNGICIRTADSSGAKLHREFGGGSDIRSEAATKIYLGWSAQPFISEVVANEINDDTGDGQTPATPAHTVVKATAVELFNPYGVALSLNGYHLEDGGSINIDLTGRYIPANGYLVITTDTTFDGTGNNGTPIPAAAQKLVDSSLQANPLGGAFTLYRPYYDRSFTPALAPVDHINYAALTDVNGTPALPLQSKGDQPKNFSIARPGGPSSSPWGPTLNTPIVARTLTPTLGSDNGGGGTNYPLPDRYATYAAGIPVGQQGNPFGMGEFARIMRITNEFDGSNNTGVILTTGGSNGGLVVDHLTQLPTTATSTAPYSTMDNAAMASMRVEAQILFDFLPSPMACATTPPSDPLGQPGQGDIRAVQLLEQIAMVDRVSEFGIDIGAGATDINKLRIPGQINVNTASGDVLRAIPNMTNQMVANILAYRARTANVVYGAGSTEGQKTSADFSNTTTYRGSGIRSLAELLIPLQASSDTKLANAKAASIDARDVLWGAIANYCTVRSDTFVVYGYLEALKVHPLFPGHNNANDWYGNVTDDPRASGYPNLRVARRRWVAIIDRSWCNENKLDSKGNPNAKYSLPRVVAIKDLPQ